MSKTLRIKTILKETASQLYNDLMKEWGEPMDGDEVDMITDKLNEELNKLNGNE